MSTTSFAALGVPASLVRVLADRGITTPTPIQAATLPDSLAGRDVLGRGRTGSGKTYAFVLPVLARLAGPTAGAGDRGGDPTKTGGRRQAGRPRALILAPTRELATQINEAMAPLAAAVGLTTCTVFGGVGQGPQVQAMRRGVDVVVACPGRLEDLINQGHVNLSGIRVTVLDEADHMSDLGFLPVVRRLLERTPAEGQRLLFSATLDAGVNTLVKRYLNKPVTHQADSAQSPVATMTHHVLHVRPEAHLDVLVDLAAAPGRKVVFTRTKHRAKKLARQLNSAGVPAVELHGNLSQGARTRTMDAFHAGTASTLVATDIAARGIHVDDVGLVIHADPPVEHKAYLHRSGRTARAGNAGTVVTLMTDDQIHDVRDLTRKAGINPTTTKVHASHPLLAELAPGERSFPGGFAATGGDAAARGPRRAAGGGRGAGGQASGGGRGNGGRAAAGGRSGERRPTAGRSESAARSGAGSSGGPRGAGARHSAAPRRSGGAAAFSAQSRAGRGR